MKWGTCSIILSILLLASIPSMLAAETHTQNGLIIAATIEREITAGTASYVERAHRQAEEQEADLFLLLLHTPGGLLQSTQDIVAILLDSEIPTAAYVHKSGGFAYSAGTYILLASDWAFMHPDSSIGAAQPRALGIEGEPDPKIVEGMASYIRSIAQARERDPDLAERFVTENITFTGREADQTGIIEGIAADQAELLSILEYPEAHIIVIGPNLFDRILGILSLPAVISLLMTAAVLGSIFVIRSGEFELLPLFLVLLFIGLWGLGSIELSVLGAILFLAGILLLIIEAAEPGVGIFGALGGLLLIFSLFTLAQEPFFHRELYGPAFYIIFGILTGLIFLFLFASSQAAGTLRKKPRTGREALEGKTGIVVQDLNPEGVVIIENYRWKAQAARPPIPKNTKIRVTNAAEDIIDVEAL